MFRLVETIRIENGEPVNLFWHQKRMETSFRKLFKKRSGFSLDLFTIVPDEFQTGTVKLRFIYDDSNFLTEYSYYFPKSVRTLKLIERNTISYSHKFIDRKNIESLISKKENCDDILIVKQNFITDISFANIVFFDGSKWFTPSTPLLKGTCRERLLFEGEIFELAIKPGDLSHFQSFRIINSMVDLYQQESIDISNIYF